MTLFQRIHNRLLLSKAIQRVTGNLTRELRPQKWVFIIGCYNSGTTLLDAILQSHADISGFRWEGASLTDSLPMPEQYGWTRMWCRCLDVMRIPPTEEADQRARRARRQWAWCLQGDDSNAVVEKSISNATRITFLDRHFPNAHFIYIVRNGYAVAEGIRRRARPAHCGNINYANGYPIEMCAEQWRITDEVVSGESKGVQRFLQISYEDLCKSPRDCLDSITDFLNIPTFSKEQLDNEWHVAGIRSRLTDMNARSLAALTKTDRRLVAEVAANVLEKYGYYLRS